MEFAPGITYILGEVTNLISINTYKNNEKEIKIGYYNTSNIHISQWSKKKSKINSFLKNLTFQSWNSFIFVGNFTDDEIMNIPLRNYFINLSRVLSLNIRIIRISFYVISMKELRRIISISGKAHSLIFAEWTFDSHRLKLSQKSEYSLSKLRFLKCPFGDYIIFIDDLCKEISKWGLKDSLEEVKIKTVKQIKFQEIPKVKEKYSLVISS